VDLFTPSFSFALFAFSLLFKLFASSKFEQKYADEVFRLMAEFCSTALLHKALKLQLCDATILIEAQMLVSSSFPF
jgi:hypothetical protein